MRPLLPLRPTQKRTEWLRRLLRRGGGRPDVSWVLEAMFIADLVWDCYAGFPIRELDLEAIEERRTYGGREGEEQVPACHADV